MKATKVFRVIDGKPFVWKTTIIGQPATVAVRFFLAHQVCDAACAVYSPSETQPYNRHLAHDKAVGRLRSPRYRVRVSFQELHECGWLSADSATFIPEPLAQRVLDVFLTERDTLWYVAYRYAESWGKIPLLTGDSADAR